MTSPDLLSATEAAEQLGLTVRHVTRLARIGRLPYAHKMPGDTGAYLFDRGDVDAFVRMLNGEVS